MITLFEQILNGPAYVLGEHGLNDIDRAVFLPHDNPDAELLYVRFYEEPGDPASWAKLFLCKHEDGSIEVELIDYYDKEPLWEVQSIDRDAKVVYKFEGYYLQ